ncbi:uncharacterized protein PHALS_12290 [Plasmopara halstedii]|uniref:Uncharacterized protein n=1 Tax=Plasmopara halstedii TaxID=4781 RepID=A0A0P1AMM3_PLAHL|nr:uncharacterized protein PHALS_12290 [Plasmopara halstedii]CEG41983.1 hypothetical protein PHALS_12290 [Plasmopara halstedii]|eukprot:XP_024578352.1 hypothetical protein PHALS_12290 [Plasmopara halstedii]
MHELASLSDSQIEHDTVRNRAALAAAIVIPKIKFLARHSWPTREIVTSKQQLVKRFVWGSREGVPERAWMNDAQAGLPMCDGGLAVPHVATDLLAMAANAVGRWAARANDVYLTPARRDAPVGGFKIATTMWKGGAAVVCGVHCDQIDPTNASFVAATAALFRRHLLAEKWDGNSLQIAVDDDAMLSFGRLPCGRRRLRGPFCHEWLYRVALDTRRWLIDDRGGAVNISILRHGNKWGMLRDLFSWTWMERGVVNFELRRPRTPAVRRAVLKLCEAMVFNYPELLHTTTHLWPVRTGVSMHHSWRLTNSAEGVIFSDATIERPPQKIASRFVCERRARTDVGNRDIRFHDHSALSRLVQLHMGEGWRPNRTRYKSAVALHRAKEGKEERDRAIAVLAEKNSDLQRATSQLKWSRCERRPGAESVPHQGEQPQLVELRTQRSDVPAQHVSARPARDDTACLLGVPGC